MRHPEEDVAHLCCCIRSQLAKFCKTNCRSRAKKTVFPFNVRRRFHYLLEAMSPISHEYVLCSENLGIDPSNFRTRKGAFVLFILSIPTMNSLLLLEQVICRLIYGSINYAHYSKASPFSSEYRKIPILLSFDNLPSLISRILARPHRRKAGSTT